MIFMDTINDLKIGELVLVSARVQGVIGDGGVHFETIARDGSSLCEYSFYLKKEELGAVIRPCAEKQETCRLFRKGDRAQVVERNGRPLTCFPVGRIKVGDIVTVAENEAGDVFIKVFTEDGHEMMVPWFMLELITPVEELEPYMVGTDFVDDEPVWNIYKDGDLIVGYTSSHPYAKEAAEAECKRLNDEWQTKVCRSEEGKEEEK